MSYHLQNQVDENAKAGLYKSIYETAVMRALVSFANDDGGSCFPALNTLAQRSQCSERTVRRVLKEFEKRSWVRIKHSGRFNRYQIMPHGGVTPREEIFTENAVKPLISRERVDSLSDQGGLIVRSDRSQSPIRMDRESNDSYQLPSSTTTPQIVSLSRLCERERSADALLEKENPRGQPKEEGNRKGATAPRQDGAGGQTSSFVTNPKNATGLITPLDTAGDGQRVPLAGRPVSDVHATTQCCACDSKHPPGMPTLEEILVEIRKLKLPEVRELGWPDEQADIWLANDAWYLHDIWLVDGFRTKNGPIKNWKASLRNWLRWRNGN